MKLILFLVMLFPTVAHAYAIQEMSFGMTEQGDTIVHKDSTVAVSVKYDTIYSHPDLPKVDRYRDVFLDDGAMSYFSNQKKILVNARKEQGFRIQLFSGGNTRNDRQKAEETMRQAKRYFPQEPIYTHFLSPRWLCRMGNYDTKEQADIMLAKAIRVGFKNACVVRSTITISKTKQSVTQVHNE